MKVLFLLIAFPDPEQHSNLYSDLAVEFTRRGHEVFVATLREASEGEDTGLQVVRGIKVLRVRCGNLFGVGLIRKGLTTLSLPRRFMAAIRQFFTGIRFDLVVFPTPPITFAPVVRRLKHEQGCRTYLVLRDIFPQNARDLGMIKDPLTYWLFRRKEQQLYGVSDYIGCMSPGNIQYVRAHNAVDPEKLEILYNWEAVREEGADGNARSIREKYGLGDRFVAVFGGNIGYAQELEFLLELARLYRDRTDVMFLIIGKGVMKRRIESIVASQDLRNVMMKDFVPRDDYNHLLRACDVGLINLDRRFTIPNIPSKVLAYFAAGIPVLAAIDRSTDFGCLLDDCGAGLWSITGDLPAYQRNFERLLGDVELRRQLGGNGRRALLEKFTVERAYETIMAHWPSSS